MHWHQYREAADHGTLVDLDSTAVHSAYYGRRAPHDLCSHSTWDWERLTFVGPLANTHHYHLPFISRLPDEPQLASRPSISFLHLFRISNFGDKWHKCKFLWVGRLSCHTVSSEAWRAVSSELLFHCFNNSTKPLGMQSSILGACPKPG